VATPDIRNLRRERARHSARWPGWIRALIVLAAFYVVYVLLGYLVVPGIIRRQVQTRASVQLKRPVTVEKAVFNPFTLTVALENVRVEDHDKQTLVSWKRLFVNLQIFALLSDEIHLAEITLDGFSSRIYVSKNGLLNIADLLEGDREPEAAKKPSKPWTLRIDRLSVTDAQIDYADESRADPFHTHVGPTTFVLRDFRTSGGPGAPGEFSATTEAGETVRWTGRLALAPLHSNGDVRLEKIALKKYAPFYEGLVRFDVAEGTLDLILPYDFSIQKNRPEIRITEAGAHLHDLALTERETKAPIFNLKSLDVEPISADLQAASVEVGRVSLSDGEVKVLRDKTGINLTRLIAAPETNAPFSPSPSTSTTANAAPAWSIRVNEIVGKNFAASLNDQSIPHPGKLQIEKVSFSARNFSTATLGTPVPIDFHASIAGEAGDVAVRGLVALQPLQADLNFTGSNLSLPAFEPWEESVLAGKVTAGVIQARADVKVKNDAKGLRIDATADADTNDFAVADANGDPVAHWKTLGVHGVDYHTVPDRIGVAEIVLTDPVLGVSIGKDHVLNLTTLLGQPAQPTPKRISAPNTAAIDSQRFMSIDRITLNNANITFTDHSIDPAVKMGLSELSGTITGLTSAEIDHGDIDIQGKIEGAAPIAITGTANLLSHDISADMKLTIRNSSLMPLGPYVGRFVGYQLSSGGLTVESHAKVVARKLDSTSNVVVSDFALGAATNSPDAPHVPIHLALALLRDANGKIVLNLPVEGSLDDPSFNFGGVVWKLIKGLIVKAATSPFSLIGSVFGGNHPNDDLSFQDFTAGSSDLSDQNTRKLDVLAKALHDRPAIHLVVHGSANPATDLPPLREAVFTQRLQAAIFEESRGIDPTIQSPDQVRVGAGAEARLIAKWYQEEFMGQPKEPEKPVVAQNTQAEQKKHFFLIRWLYRDEEQKAPSKAKPALARQAPDQSKTPPPNLPPLAEMRAKILESMPVGQAALTTLAQQRADNVQKYILEHGELSEDRVSVEPLSEPKPATRALLELR
jgi:uncharacterized protein involved in outer membrane biogenesis